MHNYRRFQYIFITLIALIFAVFSMFIANNKLNLFVSSNFYTVTSRDLLNIIFMTDEFSIYPYLSKNDITILLFVSTFYIIGIIIVSYDFLSKSNEYYIFVYSRNGNKHKVIKYMKSNVLLKSIFYSISYSITCYIMSIWFAKKNYNYIKNFDLRLLVDVTMHSIVIILALLLFQKILLFIYISVNSSISFVSGLVVLSFLLILDLQLKNINIILFSSQKHFIDSILILSVINVIMFFAEKKFLYKQLLHD